jgi:hypothetical protein
VTCCDVLQRAVFSVTLRQFVVLFVRAIPAREENSSRVTLNLLYGHPGEFRGLGIDVRALGKMAAAVAVGGAWSTTALIQCCRYNEAQFLCLARYRTAAHPRRFAAILPVRFLQFSTARRLPPIFT